MCVWECVGVRVWEWAVTGEWLGVEMVLCVWLDMLVGVVSRGSGRG